MSNFGDSNHQQVVFLYSLSVAIGVLMGVVEKRRNPLTPFQRGQGISDQARPQLIQETYILNNAGRWILATLHCAASANASRAPPDFAAPPPYPPAPAFVPATPDP